ncbi:MAG TPA: endolytic transglycosylase MltG [Dermatophilaceae bacterium]|nr:endolytic transglycosylase MltG [Dermatophilaceae bacterium]
MKKGRIESSIFGAPDHEHDDAGQTADALPTRRGERRRLFEERQRADRLRRKQRRRVRGTRRIIVLLVAFALVVGTGAVAVSVLWPLVTSLTASNDYVGSGSGAVSIAVHDGDASRTIGATLERAGVVKTAGAFEDAAANNPQSGSIQPGIYAMHSKMSARSALAMLLDPVNRKVSRVTIREGLWTSEIIRKLAAATGRPLAEYAAALKDPAMLGLPAQAKGNVEGYLFPSTYSFEPKTTAAVQLQTMVSKSLGELSTLGVTPDMAQRVLTIASIVEAEAQAAPDRPKVARVIENRLAKGMPLQLDTTVSFISQLRGKVGTTDAQRASKSPYNTYLVAGLPPGPIDSPGLSAIQVALNPTPGPWLYFVAVNPTTGETRFAVDAAGHAANVKLFLAWCSKNPGKC